MKSIIIPPSKSISHRAIICAALASGKSLIKPIQLSGDIKATLGCIKALGADWYRGEEGLLVEGNIRSPGDSVVFDCGESGSTLRFLIPIALMFPGQFSFIGHGRLMERPIGPYLKAFDTKKAVVSLKGDVLTVQGPIGPGIYRLPGEISSQFITGLLLALPLLDGDSELILTSTLESKAYVDITISVMRSFGVQVENKGYQRFIIPGRQIYRPCTYNVEADFSGAAFFLVAGALGHPVKCFGLNQNSIQGDREILKILNTCGVRIEYSQEGAIRTTAGPLTGINVDARDIPDLVPPLAALLCFCKGESRIINAGRLRMKESDRLNALTQEFNRLGAHITQGKDWLRIKGVDTLRGGNVDSHNDHRIAMALAVASIKSNGPVNIINPSCVDKSYPGFWKDFYGTERVSDHE